MASTVTVLTRSKAGPPERTEDTLNVIDKRLSRQRIYASFRPWNAVSLSAKVRGKLYNRKSVWAYEACAALFDPPIEPLEIPYENTTLPGYIHRVDRSGTQRSLIILHRGFDGSAQEMHVEGARGAVERGYNVLAFDGPGQFGPVHREGLHFRPDREKVVMPVVDFAIKLPGVDLKKIALMGFSMGGYLAPRAAAFEKRIAALIANDGLYDFGAANLTFVRPAVATAIKQGLQGKAAPSIDQAIEAKMKDSPALQWAITNEMYVMGVPTPSAYLSQLLLTLWLMA